MNRQIFALTLATRDLATTEDFYAKVFDAEVIYSDEACRIFKFGETLINCLSIENARELFAPAAVSGPGHASMLTIQVDSVDAEAERLKTLGVALNTEPTDQPWGIRTITFQDPAGQLWEFSHPL